MADHIDNTGRIVIPKRIRIACGLSAGAKLEFIPLPESQSVIVKKGKEDFCLRCGSGKNLIALNQDSFLCQGCFQALLPQKEEA